MADVNGDFGLDRNDEGIMVTTKGQVRLSGDVEDGAGKQPGCGYFVARHWKHFLRRQRAIQPHRSCCVATGRFGFGLLSANAADSGQAAAAVPHESKERTYPYRHRD